MVALRHHLLHSLFTVVLIALEVWRPVVCQMGLKTLPLTASRNRSSDISMFSKWAGDGTPSNPSINAPSIEMELAAILRDIAYGVSTEPTTTTTTTTTSTTTARPTRKVHRNHGSYENAEMQPPSSIPVSPHWEDGVWKSGTSSEDDVKHQYVESPVIEPSDDYDSQNPKSDKGSESGVIRSDFGVSEVPWLSTIGVMWEVHIYTAAGLFSILVLLSLYCLTRVHLSTQLLPRGYYVTIHLLVFLAAFFRCVYFFHDPYAIGKLLPNGLSNVLFNTGIPCIITALAVLILALLKMARLIILPLNLQSPVVVAVISCFLLSASIIIDAFGGFIKGKQIGPGLKGVIQALTAGWGAALCIGYIIVHIKIERAAKRQQNEIVRLTFSRLHIEGSSIPQRFPKSSLKCGARFTLISSISGLVLSILQVYGLIYAEMVLEIPPLNPWIWFVYQTSCRILEVTMWTCICVASALPANIKSERNKSSLEEGQLLTVFACKSCTSCSNLSSCCIYEKNGNDDMYSTICQTNHVARSFPIHSNDGKLIPQDTIACTGIPPKHISTTLVPPKTRNATNKASTLHSTGSDAQLLWNNCSNPNSSNSSSRPSSLILTEGGLIKFRTHDPHKDIIRVISYPKKDFDPKIELHSSNKKILENFENCHNTGEDNYINSGALTPEEKRILEKTFQSGKLSYYVESEGNAQLYTDVHQNIPYTNDAILSKEGYSPYRDPYRYSNKCTSVSTANSFNTNLCDGGDTEFYQDPSLNSSLESSGHIYASIQQPLEESHQKRYGKRYENDSNSQCKVLNSTSSIFQSSNNQRRPSHSSHSHSDIIQTDYLTDASQEPVESPNSDHRSAYALHENAAHLGDHYYHSKDKVSPVHGYRSFKLVQSPSMNNKQNYNEPSCNNTEVEGCPVSPSQRKRYLHKTGNSNFDNVSYFPLQGEDDQCPKSSEENIRPIGHRPRKIKHSPISVDSSLKFAITADRNHPAELHKHIQNKDGKDIGRRDTDKSRNNISQNEKDWLKQNGGESNSNESKSPLKFESSEPHQFISDRIGWTDLNLRRHQFDSLSQEQRRDKSSADFHTENIDNNDQPTEESMQVRWPTQSRDELGV